MNEWSRGHRKSLDDNNQLHSVQIKTIYAVSSDFFFFLQKSAIKMIIKAGLI